MAIILQNLVKLLLYIFSYFTFQHFINGCVYGFKSMHSYIAVVFMQIISPTYLTVSSITQYVCQ
jgi:hypothetical protein